MGGRGPMRQYAVQLLALTALLACAACGDGSRVGPDQGLKTLYVDAVLADCVGVAPQKCLRVREDPAAAWTLLYDPIVGFAYEEGYMYELRIREEHVPNPPADASSTRRVLVEVVSRTPAATTEGGGL
jgi:hypothetical protein